MAMFWPSTKPNVRSPCRNDSMRGDTGGASPGHSKPIEATLPACCAPTASGQVAAAAALPSSVMNSRRFIRSPRRRDVDAEGSRGRKIDHELELARLDDGQIGWLGALEDAAGVDTDLAKRFRQAHSIAHQRARFRIFACVKDGGNGMTRC